MVETPASRAGRRKPGSSHTWRAGDALVAGGDEGELVLWRSLQDGDKDTEASIADWKLKYLLQCASRIAPCIAEIAQLLPLFSLPTLHQIA